MRRSKIEAVVDEIEAWASGSARDVPLAFAYSTRKSDEKRKSAGK